jgi:hypothetical protein
MKKNHQPRLVPLFISLCVVLTSAPQALFAQVMANAGAAGAAAPAAVAGVAGVAALPVQALPLIVAPQTGAPLTALAAPSAFPESAVPAAPAAEAAAAPAPSALRASDSEVFVRTPGAAATHLAAEAAAYSESPAAPKPAVRAASPKTLLGRLTAAVLGRRSAPSMFDGASERALPVAGRQSLKEMGPLDLPNGTKTDDVPTLPSPDREQTVVLSAYSLPGARDVGGIFETARKVLNADPSSVDAVVGAVKTLIDSDPTRYGVPSADLRLIAARSFKGEHGLADTIFIHFRQVKDGIMVHGANLSFTVKVIGGKPTIVAQTGQIFPSLDVDTQSTLTEDQIQQKIAERTGLSAQDVNDKFEFFAEKIIYSRGKWRHVKLYVAEGLPFMVAVDMAEGVVFAWDNRTGLQSSKKAPGEPAVSGSAAGKAVDHGPILPTAEIKEIPLAHMNLTIGGKTYVTDVDGNFSADGLAVPAEGLKVEATLAGPYAKVEDTTGKTLTITATIKPGEGPLKLVFNPDANLSNENALAQVSAFNKVNLAYTFLKARNLTTKQMDENPIVVRTNIDDECNAYYTPGSPSLNFFRSSENCVNSAYDTVADHEYGHYWDDMTGGIMNGGLSEGWGDTLSMYLLNNPIIGEHFLKKPGPDGKDYIRNGENTYKYNQYDEVHAQGQAWQGFTWKLRKKMIEELGAAAGAAMAEALVLPTMFAKAANIPDAMAQVLVNAIKSDGTIAYEGDIRSIAQFHGVTLPQHPAPGKTSLLAGLTAPLRRLSAGGASYESLGGETGTQGLLAQPGDAVAPTARGTLKFSAGALLRGRVANEIRRYLDEAGVKYQLHEYKGLLSSDFLLVIEGPQDQVRAHGDAILAWMRSIDKN